MSFKVKQYVYKGADSAQSYQPMVPYTGSVEAKRERMSTDSNVIGPGNAIEFEDECIKLSQKLDTNKSYYFHAKIKRESFAQIFDIFLVNSVDREATQYLKTITVGAGNPAEWTDLQIIFSPVSGFDLIFFQLKRSVSDYRDGIRYSTIVYEELSELNNLVKILNSKSFIKMGVRSTPGTIMCVNGEEIHIGRTGVYEVRNGVVSVDFFSIAAHGTENLTTLTIPGGGRPSTYEEYLKGVAKVTPDYDTVSSRSIINNGKTRKFEPFILDYMYEESEG